MSFFFPSEYQSNSVGGTQCQSVWLECAVLCMVIWSTPWNQLFLSTCLFQGQCSMCFFYRWFGQQNHCVRHPDLEPERTEQYSLSGNITAQTDGGRLHAWTFHRLVCILATLTGAEVVTLGSSHPLMLARFCERNTGNWRSWKIFCLLLLLRWKAIQKPFPSLKCFWLVLGERPQNRCSAQRARWNVFICLAVCGWKTTEVSLTGDLFHTDSNIYINYLVPH